MKREETDNLDRLLSGRLKRALDDDGKANWLDVCKRAGLSTRWHWSRARVVLVAAVLVLGVAACAQSTGIIPWFNHHPAPVKAPRSAPPCRVTDLRVQFSHNVSPNGINDNIRIVNEGRNACSLAGRPRLKLIDPQVSKPRLLEKYSVPPKPAPGSFDPTPLSLLRAVPPHESAIFGFNWKNWCGPGPAPRAFELRLPGGGTIVHSFHSFSPRDSNLWPVRSHLSLTAPRCEDKRRQTELDYGPFYPLWAPKSALRAYGVKSVLPLRVSVVTKGLPTVRRIAKDFRWGPWKYVKGREYSFVTVKRGAVLHFRVALRNTSKRPFRFAHCPLYNELLANSTMSKREQGTYVLNCHPAGSIAPGKVAYFAMELHVAKDQPLGQTYLGWELVDGNRDHGPRPAAVWVVP